MTTKTKPEPPRAQDLTREQKRAILLSVPCDRCEAPAGKNCPSSQTHAARYAAVSKAGLIQW